MKLYFEIIVLSFQGHKYYTSMIVVKPEDIELEPISLETLTKNTSSHAQTYVKCLPLEVI